jgi:hypothetical protein
MKISNIPMIVALLATTLAGCGNDHPPAPQPQYQQPVVIQQAPAAQQDNSGTNMLAGAALGAAAAMALSDRDRHYDNRPRHVEYENKTTIVNNYHGPKPNVAAPVTAAAVAAATPARTPVSDQLVNMAKTAPPVVKPSYAAPGTASPVPAPSQAFLTGNKTLTVSNTSAVKSYAPAATPALPAPKPMLALPAPTQVSLAKPAPTATQVPKTAQNAIPRPSNYNYKPLQASYTPTKSYSSSPSYKPSKSYSSSSSSRSYSSSRSSRR